MNKTPSDTKEWMTPAEVAAYFRVSPVTVRAWAAAGKISFSLTPGGHRRFSSEDIEEFARRVKS